MWIITAPESSPSAPASEGSTLESNECFPLLEQSVMWRGKPRALRSWRTAWKRDLWIKRLCGRISRPSTAQLGVELWISSLRDTPVSRSRSEAGAKARTTRGTSGPTLPGSPKKYVQLCFSWRTSKDTSASDSEKSSMTLPQWGLMQRGVYTAQPKPDFPIAETDSSSWPTPTARDWKDGADPSLKVPTNGRLGLLAPRATGAMFPGTSGLRLNPIFTESLMGFPIGWTAFAPLATQSFPSRPHSH